MANVLDKNIYNLSWARKNGKLNLKVLTHEKEKKKVEYVPAPERRYFYLKEKDYNERRDEVLKVLNQLAPGYEVKKGNFKLYKAWRIKESGDMVKITVPFPDQLDDVREVFEKVDIQTYESDVPYKVQILKDYDLSIAEPKNILYFDIEVEAKEGMPDVEKANQRIIAIGAIGSDGQYYFICDDSEKKILKEFKEISKEYSVLGAWNGVKFDKPYILKRAEKLGIRMDPFFYPLYDGLRLLKRAEKKGRESYALKAVAKEDFDMDLRSYEKPGQMRKLMESFKDDRLKLYNYVMGDVEATKRIFEKYDLISTFNELASICHIHPYQKLWPSVFIDGLLLNIAKDLDPVMVFDKRRYHEDIEKKGAIVECYGKGLYEKAVTLDFSSYYPTLIRTFNMGIDTFDPSKESEIKAPYGSFRADKKSIIVKAIEQLYNIRERAKKKMRNCEPDSEEWKFWYSKSWAAKLILVSFFGVMGFEHSRIYRQEIFEDVTGLGRRLLEKSKEIGEQFGYTGLYMDSVSGDTCIVVKDNNKVQVKRIDQFEGEWTERPDGKQILPLNVEMLTGAGWKQTNFIVRHKTKKPLYIYNYHTSVPCVTEDHSIINTSDVPIKPEKVKHPDQVKKNHQLDFKDIKIIQSKKGFSLDYDLGYLFGVYIADGSISKSVRAVGTRDKKLAKKIYNIAKEKLNDENSKKPMLLESSDRPTYYVHLPNKYITLFRKWLGDSSQTKQLPPFFFNSPRRFKKGIIDGYVKGDGNRRKNGWNSSTVSRKLASQLALYATMNGFIYSVRARDLREKGPTIKKGEKIYKREQQSISYMVKITTNTGTYSKRVHKGWKNKHEVEKIRIEDEEYVYDVSTEDGTFVDSLGGTVLKNTDGIIFNMKPSKDVSDVKEDLKKINIGLQKHCKEKYNTSSELLRLKIDRVYKTLYLLGKKKRYFGLTMIEGEKRAEKLIVKGLETVRSDWPPIARNIQKKCMKMITKQMSNSSIIAYLRLKKREVLEGKHDKDFVVYTGLGNDLEDYESVGPHVRVARKLKKQGIPIRKGDKIPHIWTGNKAVPAMDPDSIELTQKDRKDLWQKHIIPVVERIGIDPNQIKYDLL